MNGFSFLAVRGEEPRSGVSNHDGKIIMIYTTDEEPIIAQCTPTGSGAIALLRMSGHGVFAVAQKMATLSSGNDISQLPSHTIHLGSIHHPNGTIIDQVLFLLMRAPKTYTGHDVIEISCHNNQFIIEAIIQCALTHGARLAHGGEFTKRAVLNNKIDLIQAEAVNELIHAQTQTALKQSLSQLHGSLSHVFTKLEQLLLKAIALCSASFEFIDEEMEFGSEIKTLIEQCLHEITQLQKNFHHQDHLRSGIRIALIGTVNAGKSSLFNALLGRNRAIVSPHAGTTRDSIEAGITKYGNCWTLIDTAGLRQTDNSIEQEGIIRATQEAEKADIIILVCDASRALTAQEQEEYDALRSKWQHKIVTVYTKADIAQTSTMTSDQYLLVSAQTHHGIESLEVTLQKKVTELFASLESPFLLTKRQHALLINLEQKLAEINGMFVSPLAYELLSVHLTDALACMSELTGKTVSEAAMDAIFKEFCIGK